MKRVGCVLLSVALTMCLPGGACGQHLPSSGFSDEASACAAAVKAHAFADAQPFCKELVDDALAHGAFDVVPETPIAYEAMAQIIRALRAYAESAYTEHDMSSAANASYLGTRLAYRILRGPPVAGFDALAALREEAQLAITEFEPLTEMIYATFSVRCNSTEDPESLVFPEQVPSGFHGVMKADIVVDGSGHATDVTLASSSNDSTFDAAFKASLMQEKFLYGLPCAGSARSIAQVEDRYDADWPGDVHIEHADPTCEAAAQIVKEKSAAYPQDAYALRLGLVTALVHVAVDATGAVTSASIVQSTGVPSMDRAAIDAAKESTYSPAHHLCKPISGTYTFRADFAPEL